MSTRWVFLTAAFVAGASLAGCGGSGGGGSEVQGLVNVRGNVAGLAAGTAARPAGLATPAGNVAVTMVAETGGQAASQVVTPADGEFSLTVPVGHEYVMVLRQGSSEGRFLGILIADGNSGRTAFSLPPGSAGVDLGTITVDPKQGKAWSATAQALAAPAAPWADADGDGIPNAADLSDDEDGDGVGDRQDALAFDEAESEDSDGDRLGDNADDDDDNDGIADAQDAFPKDARESGDKDGDGTGDNADTDDDNDGVADAQDPFPVNPAEAADTDGDGIGNSADPDADNDGVADAQDAFPTNPAETVDTDGDGIGNSADPDDDNDGLTDVQEAALGTNLLKADTDGDGVADARDVFPSNPAETVDTDGDGVGNNADVDDDNDGLPDAREAVAGTDPLKADTDNDGVADGQDAFPANSAETVDTDADLVGNNADLDDDNDGAPDGVDKLPLVPNVSNVPTDRGPPSPLFGAESFNQQMVLFEEFGTEPFDPAAPPPGNPLLPPPQDPRHGPEPTALEAFLAQAGAWPYPARLAASEDFYLNPWQAEIQGILGRALQTPPADGRPQGEGWSHQRWDEFYPQRFFKTSLAGARVNGGFRDGKQRHGYNQGEFAPGGLYHTVYAAAGGPTLAGTTAGLPIQIHPRMPIQDPNSVWTFDGTLPPKLLQARHGEATLMRNYNALPIDVTANQAPGADPFYAFGRHTITTHEHNGHSPGESDGFAGAFFFPGQFYDYRWPLQLAGYDGFNTTATEPKAAFPCEPGETLPVNGVVKTCENGRIQLRGDWRETMSTHWFHDHMLDHTAENVYKGNAVMMNYYSAVDRGNEAIDDGVNLRFPSGTALSWGNRDYDINLLVADKAWDAQGQLWYNPHNFDGFLGDRLLANWLYHPYLDVRARRYRFRILDGAVSRIMAFALVQQVQGDTGEIPGPAGSGISYNRVPFHMIANDGNVLEHAVPFDGTMDLDGDGDLLDHKGHLPSQSIAERYDIVVDFSRYQPGDKLYFVNVLEHEDGKGSKQKIPLEDILSERYKAEPWDGDGDGAPDRWINGDPCVEKFLELRVHAYSGTDLSMNPADYEPGKKKMIPLKFDRSNPADQALLANAVHHTFEFKRSNGGSETPWQIRVDGNGQFPMDPHRVAALERGALEIWHIGGNSGWTHPVHIHFEEGIILTRGGKAPPEWEKWARKDMYRVGPEDDSTSDVEIVIQAREFVGTFVEHCHNTMHEDHAMLLRWDGTREDVNTITLAPTPMPSWDGVELTPSVPWFLWTTFSTLNNGDGIGPSFPLQP